MKIHIAISETPLSAGQEALAVCGQVVPNAQWIWTAENGGKAVKEIFNALQLCTDCWRAAWDGRYVYGCVSVKSGVQAREGG